MRAAKAPLPGLVPAGDPFGLVVADPPWSFGDKLPGATRGAERNYSTLPLSEVKAFFEDRPHLALDDDALLFLWRVSAMQEEALEVIRRWRFVQKAEIVWVKTTPKAAPYLDPFGQVKTKQQLDCEGLKLEEFFKLHFGMGHYTRAAHETCLIARRGRAKVSFRAQRSVFFAPTGEHSEKPDAFFNIVQRMDPYPGQRRLELFARKPRWGWTQVGDQLPDPVAPPA